MVRNFEERFQADILGQVLLRPIQERQLVDEDRSQDKAAGIGQACGGHWSMPIEDALDMLVEVLR